MPGSSINSWDSWFIFNLHKNKHLLLCEHSLCMKTATIIGNNSMYILNNVFLECWLPMSVLCVRKLNISLQNTHILIIVHTWASGLQSSWGTSRAPPAWSPSGHVLTLALSPFQSTHGRSHAPPEDIVYILNDSCSHFTNIFSLQLSLLAYWASYFNTACIHVIHYICIHTSYIILQYTTQRMHVYLASSFLEAAAWYRASLSPIGWLRSHYMTSSCTATLIYIAARFRVKDTFYH